MQGSTGTMLGFSAAPQLATELFYIFRPRAGDRDDVFAKTINMQFKNSCKTTTESQKKTASVFATATKIMTYSK